MRGPWTFAQRVGVGLGLSLVAALAIVAAALLAVYSVRASSQATLLARSEELLEVERLRRDFSDKVAGVRGFALTGDAHFQEDVGRARQRFLETLGGLRQRPALGAARVEGIAQAERAHQQAVERLLRTRGEDQGAARVEAVLRQQVLPRRQRVLEALEGLAGVSQGNMAASVRRAEEADAWAQALVTVAAGLGLVGVTVLAWVLAARLRPLHQQAEASSERFRLLVEGVRDYALYLLDAQGRVASWNPGAERIKGWSEREVLGQPVALFYPPEAVRAGVPEGDLARAARDGRLRTEGWRLRKDGTRFWAEVVYTALRGPEGRLTGFAKVTRDVTERRRTERTWQLFSEAGRLFQQSLDPDVTVGGLARLLVPELADGCVLYLEEGSGRLGPRVVAHVAPDKEALVWELIQRYPPVGERGEGVLGVLGVLRTGQSRRVPEVTETLLARGAQDGEHLRLLERLGLRSYLCVALRVGEASRGALVLLSEQPGKHYTAAEQVVVEELAGRAALALENARLVRQAQQALELVAVAAHDVGNPLQTLRLGLTRLGRLDAAAEPERVAQGLASALGQVEKVGQLLHNLLDVSRLSVGRLELDVAGVDLGELVHEVARRHAEAAEEVGSRLEVQAQLGVVGRWDRLRLERVVTNLLSNALKFARGRPVEVRVEGQQGRARLEVRDFGQGVAPEAQRRIFERFERGGVGAGHEGFGLGLYIVRQLVEAHGGSIRVESRQPEGAAFIVELPLVPVEVAQQAHGATADPGPRP